MNLELLDPFQIKIPDRIDATLRLPDALHFRRPVPKKRLNQSQSGKKQDASHHNDDWKAANHLAYNRRGTYVAIGYGSGTVAIFDTLSRTLSAVYPAAPKIVGKAPAGAPATPATTTKAAKAASKSSAASVAKSKSASASTSSSAASSKNAISKNANPKSASPKSAISKSAISKSANPKSASSKSANSKGASPKSVSKHKIGSTSKMDVDSIKREKSASKQPASDFTSSVGVTCVSWSKKSRTLLVGAANETLVRLIDTTHPLGPRECNHDEGDTSDVSKKKANGTSASSNGSSNNNASMPGKDGSGKSTVKGSNSGSKVDNADNDDDEDDTKSQTSTEQTTKSRSKNKYESSFIERLESAASHSSSVSGSHVTSKAGNLLNVKNLYFEGDSKLHSDLNTTANANSDSQGRHSRRRQRRQFPPKHPQRGIHADDAHKRVPFVQFHLPAPFSSSLQVHPRDACAGIATLTDGSLVAFWVPHEAFEPIAEPASVAAAAAAASKKLEPKKKKLKHVAEDKMDVDDKSKDKKAGGKSSGHAGDKGKSAAAEASTSAADAISDQKAKSKMKSRRAVKLAAIHDGKKKFISCAAFDPSGERLYAATKDGHLMGFELGSLFDNFQRSEVKAVQTLKPSFTIPVPGGAQVWHLMVSRNGQFLAMNSADAAIRLYSTKACWEVPEEVEKPMWVFQDVVNKVKFASCDISGDAEYLVAGANGHNNQYELFIWNISTGVLMDKLKGSGVTLYSVAYHPARSFFACATSDGLIDVWSPRINWTSFAPDFQALPANVEYVEQEDEFDIVPTNGSTQSVNEKDEEDEEDINVDVVNIEPVPAFASDSENEEDIFSFPVKVMRHMGYMTG